MINPLFQCLPPVSESDLFNIILSDSDRPLCADVGAGMGLKALAMLSANQDAEIICFEPFPGNADYLRRRVGRFPSIRTIDAAVGDFSGPGLLHVRSTADTTKEYWKDYPGYSSVGKLIPRDRASEVIEGKIYEVEVLRLDDVVDRRLRFLKIDVQGGESAVLRGAQKTIERHGIDAIFCEFSGDMEVLSFLEAAEYEVFDFEYVFVPRKAAEIRSVELVNAKTTQLSTGKLAAKGLFLDKPHEPAKYAMRLRSIGKELGYIQTDLLCIHKSAMPGLMKSLFRHLAGV